MPFLEIRHRTGMIESRELSKDAPLLVGQLPANDIRIEAEGVAPLHCRISWKRKTFEVAAVTAEGVQFNGKTVQQAPLAPGDVIRVGDVDIVLLAEQRPANADQHDATGRSLSPAEEPTPGDTEEEGTGIPSVSQMDLRPITEDSLPVRSFFLSDRFKKEEPGPTTRTAVGASGSGQSGPTGEKDRSSKPAEPRRPGMSRLVEVALDLDELARQEQIAVPIDPPEIRRSFFPGGGARTSREPHTARRRPGDQDPLRSPVVIGLSLGGLVLLLSAATIWFVLAREKSQRQYDAAHAELMSGQYPQAIESFELFLKENPRHKLAAQARVDIGTARVEQAIGGTSPAWDKGLEALAAYIDQHRDTEPFQKPESPLRQFALDTAGRIASGALETARTTRKRPLLAVAAEAVKLVELYSPSDNRPEARLNELAKAAALAEAAILQQETFDTTVRAMDDALAAKEPAAALQQYRHVLDRYKTEAGDYRLLKDRLRKTLELERSLTVRDEGPKEAVRDAAQPAGAAAQLTLARRSRARTDVASTGATVFVLAEDCLYGVDSATGEALWRRAIGLDPPFSPVVVSVGQPALLVCDWRHRELVLVLERTGAPVWRLALTARPLGSPLVYEGQIYLSTEEGQLEQIDMQTGRSSARLKFRQKVVGPPAVSLSGERMYLSGHENVLYVLTRRPLACEQVVWLGHAPGSIEAPLLMMRSYLLVAENDRQSGCTLRVLDTSHEDQAPPQIAAQRIAGHVRDLPLLRGKQLFVPSTPERISAFTVAETADAGVLSSLRSYQVKKSAGSPIFLSAGPDDQLWMYSSSLRKFELTPDSLLPDKQQIAMGIASGPLQASGASLFLARRLPYSRAVLFAEADRQQMIVQWQLALGELVLAASSPATDGTVLCVTSLGDLFLVTPQKLARGGFELQSVGQVPVPEGLTESLSATRLADGRLVVFCGGAQPRLWLPGSDGQSREQKLEEGVQAAPVRMAGGLLLALPGRLRLIGRAAGETTVEDLPAPIGQEAPPRWRSLAAFDETQALVLSEAGRVARIQFGTSPVGHLEEVTHWDAGNPVDFPMALAGGRLLIVDSTVRLVMLDARSLEPLAQVALEGAPSAHPRPAGSLVVVELKAGRLVAFDMAAKLTKRWELGLEGGALTGDPLIDSGRLIIPLDDGRVLFVDAATGEVRSSVDLGQRLGFGPEKWGENIVVGTLDGSLVLLNGRGDAAK